MYTKHHLVILYRLLNLRCIGVQRASKQNALRGFPKRMLSEGERAYSELLKWNLIFNKSTLYGEQVSLNPQHLVDIKQILSPANAENRDKPPLENSLNSKYEKRPFHTTYGDKTIRGVNARYSYHRGVVDSSKIACYVIVDNEKRSTIELGSFIDKESLLVKATMCIDETFKGKPFSKPDLYSLGKDIEGNRQQPKAIIDMLLFFGYIVQVGERHYQRTYKKPPAIGLDAFQPSTEPPSSSSIQPITDYFKAVEIKDTTTKGLSS